VTTTTAPGPDTDDVELFETPPSRRPFSAGDVLRLVVGLVLALAGVLLARLARSTIGGLESDLLRAFGRLPDGLEEVVLTLAQAATSLIPTVALVVLLVRRRWKVALLLLLTGVLATLAMALVDALVIDRDLADLIDRLETETSVGDAGYPDSRVLASTTAVVTVAAPWLSRRWKRALWGGVALLVLLRLIAPGEPAFDLVLALGVGFVVGSLVLLVFGSPSNEPRPRELLDALRACGFAPRRIDRVDAPGSETGYRFADADGTAYAVALRTPDERDADMLDRTYRWLRFRASEVGTGYASLKRRIEHETLVLTLADRAGVRAPDALRIGTTERGSAFLVTRDAQTRPAGDDDLRRPGFLDDLWAQVRLLHGAGVAHRQLTREAVHVDEAGRPWLFDFDGAQTAPSTRERARDIAELLTETAVVVGAHDAVAAAVRSMGRDAVAPSLRMLQPLALPPTTRRRAKDAPDVLEELRDEVNAATGEPGLSLEHLERIKPRTLLIVLASSLAFYSLLPQLANLGDTVDAFGDASLPWIGGVLVASAVTYLFASLSFQGAVADPVPFAPNLRAQVASSFATLVGPAGAGGFALTTRFLQRNGVQSAEAGASVAVNAIAGFAMHVALMITFIVWSGRSELDGISLPSGTTVLVVVAIVLALVGVLVAIAPVRRRLLAPAWHQVKTGVSQMARVFTSPARVVALFGGSAALSLTYVVAVACSVEAFGGGLGFAQIGAAYLAAVAIATLAPTPGGLGALESAMIAGLVAFGLSDAVAVSATLTFRLATFWLPVLPGWVVFGWMQRHDEL
jgi:uncharacterized membrane protein YbhN (UPF0104 family)/tRNA A-37 threonylcarbamoyl transferase component Bud32